MRVEANQPCPLPDDSLLAGVASALEAAGHGAWIVDAGWHVVYMSHEQRLMSSGSPGLVPVILGGHLFGTDQLNWGMGQRHGPNSPEAWRDYFSGVGGMVLADTAGGSDELLTLVDPSLREVVEELAPEDGAVASWSSLEDGVGGRFEVRNTALRIRDASGTLRGTVQIGVSSAQVGCPADTWATVWSRSSPLRPSTWSQLPRRHASSRLETCARR